MLGDGATPCNLIFTQLGLSAPSHIKHDGIRSVLSNPSQRFILFQALPPLLAHDFKEAIFTDLPDQFVWRGARDGRFSTKSYFESFQTRYGSIGWGSHIWKSWIPTKISCFIWKIFHMVTPTDDNISRLGIPLVSKCDCCSLASQETAQHLLFQGQWAQHIWTSLGRIFDRPKIRGLAAFRRVWLCGSSKEYMTILASSIACVALWEIWKARNHARFESGKRDCLFHTLQWAPKLARLIPASYRPSYQNNLILLTLKIPIPCAQPIQPIGQTTRWPPHFGPPVVARSQDDQLITSRIRYNYVSLLDDHGM